MKSLVFHLKTITAIFVFSALTACGGGGGGGGDNGGTPVVTIIYVSTLGNDTSDGLTPATAKATIADTIASASGQTDIYVAAGNYDISAVITLKPNVSLYGGYTTDFASRDPSVNTTTITNIGSVTVNRVFTADNASIDNNTIVDGFTLHAGNGISQSITIELSAASPTISNNTIIGGSGSDPHAIRISDLAEPLIENNVITNCRICINFTGNAGNVIIANNSITALMHNASIGISATLPSNPEADIIIEGNIIQAGGTPNNFGTSTAISTAANNITIRGNRIHGGNSTTTNIKVSRGIYVSGGSATIINNMIYGGTGSDTYGIVAYRPAFIANNTIHGGSGLYATVIASTGANATPTIQNNIMLTAAITSGTCIGSYNSSQLLEVDNNSMTNCKAYLSNTNDCPVDNDGDGSAQTCSIVDMENFIGNSAGNHSGVPIFVNLNGDDGNITTIGDNDWRLSAVNSADIYEGGLDLSTDFSYDFDGVMRTAVMNNTPTNANAAGWSIGAFELDQ